MKNAAEFFEMLDDYHFYLNTNQMLTLDEYHERESQMADSEACFEIDSDAAYEKHMHDLAVEQSAYKGEVSWTR